jgi:hypothetical protein
MKPTPANHPVRPSCAVTPAANESRWLTLLAALLIVSAGLATYSNSFQGPLIFDDAESIAQNPTIRHLWPVGPVLSPPAGGTVAGRPLLNLTLAINYAIGGSDVRGYHTINLALHLLAALVLMGVVRRTLQSPTLCSRYGAAALPLAAAAGLLWVLHPLQTESVTYLVQRTESLAGLFYLLTLYAVIRGARPGAVHPRIWNVLAVAACLLGAASKEVVVTAPLVVLAYDRTFLTGSFREAWRRRRRLYLALACTWPLLALLILRNYLLLNGGWHPSSSGFDTGINPWQYALTQAWAITHYLRLTFWPSPLILDYGAWLARGPREVWPAALLVGLLLAGTAVAMWRRPALGFLGVWFFACLAPTSSLMPIARQTIAEHRMYLALAAPVTLVTVAAWTLCCRLWPIAGDGAAPGIRRLARLSVLLPLALAAALLATATYQRNHDYRSALSLWQDTSRKRPDNPRACTTWAWPWPAEGRSMRPSPSTAEPCKSSPTTLRANTALATRCWGADKPTRPSPICRRPWQSDPTSPRPTMTWA